MFRRICIVAICTVVLTLASQTCQAQDKAYGASWGNRQSSQNLSRFYHYPYVTYPLSTTSSGTTSIHSLGVTTGVTTSSPMSSKPRQFGEAKSRLRLLETAGVFRCFVPIRRFH